MLRYVDRAGLLRLLRLDADAAGRRALQRRRRGHRRHRARHERPVAPAPYRQPGDPGVQSPHESLLLNQRRGLLVAVTGNAATNAGVLDVYDVRETAGRAAQHQRYRRAARPASGRRRTCRLDKWPNADLDVSDPRLPRPIWTRAGVVYRHARQRGRQPALRRGDRGAGRRRPSNGGLVVFDVSQIQAREPDPEVPVVSKLAWRSGSIPKVPIPITIQGAQVPLRGRRVRQLRDRLRGSTTRTPRSAPRLIDIDERRPRVVSNIRLQVNQPWARRGASQDDPGARSPVQGYASHYCSVPRAVDPVLVACASSPRACGIFDIRDPRNPREVGLPSTGRWPPG